MATIAAKTPALAANAVTQSNCAAGGDDFVNTGKELLLIEHTNGAGADVTLTIVTQVTVEGLAVADRTIVIPKGTMHLIGPFPKGTYNDVDGKVQLTYSSETDMKISVLKPA